MVIPLSNDSRLLEVYSLEDIHLIAHKGEIICVNLTRYLEVLNLSWVLAVGIDLSLQGTRLVEVNDIVLTSLATVGVDIGNPIRNLGIDKLKLVLASVALAVYLNSKGVLLARLVGKCLALLEAVGVAIDGDGEECIVCCHALWNNDSAHSTIRAIHHKRTLSLSLANSGDIARSEVDGSTAGGVSHICRLANHTKLTLGKACTLLKHQANRCHTVVEGHTNTILAWSDILDLAPQEVRCGIATIVSLILLNLELISRGARWMSVRIVAKKVDVGLSILIIYRASRVPDIIGLVVGVLGVVHLVTLVKERALSRVIIRVVHAIETNLVAIAETTIINTSEVLLRDITTQIDRKHCVGSRAWHHNLDIGSTAHQSKQS